LQVLNEVIGRIVIKNTADGIFIIVERNDGIAAPGFPEDLCAVEGVGMLDPTNCLAGTDTVGVVGVGVTVKGLQLSTLFPSQSVTQASKRIALLVAVYNYSSGMSISEKQPHPERCG
jgi:hypothetical protein